MTGGTHHDPGHAAMTADSASGSRRELIELGRSLLREGRRPEALEAALRAQALDVSTRNLTMRLARC